jgi:hypothetical protein
MKNKKRVLLIAVMLMLSIGNFVRLKGNENIRAIQYISLLAIGALLAMLIQGIIFQLKNKN